MGANHTLFSQQPTNAVREQPELILIKEEPVEVDTGDSGTEREWTNEKSECSHGSCGGQQNDNYVEELHNKLTLTEWTSDPRVYFLISWNVCF